MPAEKFVYRVPRLRGFDLDVFESVEVWIETKETDLGTSIDVNLVINAKVKTAGFMQWFGQLPKRAPVPPSEPASTAPTS